MSKRPTSRRSSSLPSPKIIALFIAVGIAIFGIQILIGVWWTLGILVGLVLLVALVLLVTAKTAFGKRVATAVMTRVGRTRLGRRFAKRQLHWAARSRGIAATDAAGRPLTDIELQLAMMDTPEARAIKKQLATMNPIQRAQALRVMQAQADEAQRTGVAPTAPKPPKQRYGRPR